MIPRFLLLYLLCIGVQAFFPAVRPASLRTRSTQRLNGIFPGDDDGRIDGAGDVQVLTGQPGVGGGVSDRNKLMAEMMGELTLFAGKNDAAAENVLSSYRDILLAPFLEETPSAESIFTPEESLTERREVYAKSMAERVEKASTLALSRALDMTNTHVLRLVDEILKERQG
mmetsp:Transcript_62404/g.141111  ORF Transcript_62404/g.141111 Transcript_62404/m.141111 type:complete len:171 (-) Transcript_62404:160-672(-)|eukprot:CAMPEP_0172607066 /NCGR_PEP_ID=MMETSP1068-20121228/27286_1 /TAXON_ID=35684 /ORGANISM="Pseudopedinella elastica, Strain CCMP716" /LENGTH=170 /DNA_ID=CAMNT_0013409993 /DNA_START=64 /DNA_END=576 /DNA_ORIENTATION=+